jgi:hypothetical protein
MLAFFSKNTPYFSSEAEERLLGDKTRTGAERLFVNSIGLTRYQGLTNEKLLEKAFNKGIYFSFLHFSRSRKYKLFRAGIEIMLDLADENNLQSESLYFYGLEKDSSKPVKQRIRDELEEQVKERWFSSFL